ncbi:MAG: DUF2993 domain-containing protein [Veillonellales bacterium]
MKRLIGILAVLGVLLAAGQMLLPPVVSQLVSQGMKSQTGSDQVSVQLEKKPALGMLGGSFDKITLSAVNAKTDKLTFSELNGVMTDVQLDRNALLEHQTIVLQSVGNVQVVGTLTEAELARYLNQSVKGIRNAAVAITPDKVTASSSFAIGNFANVGITLEGRIAVDSQKVKFVTERFLINNTVVGNIGGAALTEIPLLDLKKLPFGVTVRDVVMEQGKVVIYTDNQGGSGK